MVNISQQDVKATSNLSSSMNELFTNNNQSENSKLLHVTFFFRNT